MPVKVSDQIYANALRASVGSCTAGAVRFDSSNLPPPSTTTSPVGPQLVLLDAGPVLNIVNPMESEAMPKIHGTYSAGAANLTFGGVTTMFTGDHLFNEPGAWVLNNGAGGSDIGAFRLRG